MVKKRHIIFDMDGTLSDTAKATVVALYEVGKQYKLPRVTDERIRAAMGLAGPEFYAHLYPHEPKETLMNIERTADVIEEAMITKMGKEILFPGVGDMLADLSEKGYCLYIASTGSESHVHNTLASCGIEGLFTSVSCGKSEKISMVKSIIAGRNTDEWAMVGDMFKDSEAARGNNILALGAGFGYLAKDDYPLFDSVLLKPEDIYKYVNG